MEAYEAITTRCSCRDYIVRQLSEEQTEKLIRAAPFVPYCNASCMAENIMIEANALGLASVFLMGVPTVMKSRPELLQKLNIADGFEPAIVVAVGYAVEPVAEKKPMRILVERF